MKKDSPFAARLKTLIQERDLTHREVGEAAGVTKNAVGKWLQGTVPGAGEVFKLARAFNKPMEWFFEGIPPQPASAADRSALHAAPEAMPADKFLAAARAIVLSGEMERLVDLSLNYRQVWTRTPTAFEMHYEPLAPEVPAAALEKTSTRVLTPVREYANLATMTSPLANLIERLKTATATKGMKAELADFLHVPRSCVSDWLSARRQPGGETTLKLLHWVEQQEAQQKQSPGSVQPPPGRKTQSKVPNEKKPKSSPLKE